MQTQSTRCKQQKSLILIGFSIFHSVLLEYGISDQSFLIASVDPEYSCTSLQTQIVRQINDITAELLHGN